MKKLVFYILLLSLLLSVFQLASCHVDPGSSDVTTTPDTSDAGADLTTVEEIPEIPDMEGSMIVSSSELLSMIREDRIAENGSYTVQDGKEIVFDATDNNKTYDLKNAVIRLAVRPSESGILLSKTNRLTLRNANLSVYGGTALSAEGGRNTTLSELHISGNAKAGFVLNSNSASVSACSFCSEKDGALENAIVAKGTDVSVSDCNFRKVSCGVTDLSQNGSVIENNLFEDCTISVSVGCANSVVWYNTVRGGECGVRAVFEKAEISASEAVGYNILVAKNQISGAKKSVAVRNASNSVLLFNELDSADVEGCINIYVCENTLTETLSLVNNNYLIADRNASAELAQSGNANQNGDTVTDLSVRELAGANEELLPHINSEQFVGMERSAKVRTLSGSKTIDEYIADSLLKNKTVIVPPGCYIGGSKVNYESLTDVDIYAYGVYEEFTAVSQEHAIQFNHCKRTSVYGLFIGYSQHPHIQGTVTQVRNTASGLQVSVAPDPGYIQDFSTTGKVEGRIFDADSFRTAGLIRYSSVEYDAAKNINVFSGCSVWSEVSKGTRVAFRAVESTTAGGFSFKNCSEMKLEDATVFNASGFAELDVDNEIAPTLHRYAVKRGPAPLLAEGSESDSSTLITTDLYGRSRSAAPLLTTIDATHCTNARTGIQIISCLFEGMDDDTTNINAYYGLTVSYDSATRTLTYGRCHTSYGYQRLPADFRDGELLALYTEDGEHISTVSVQRGTEAIGNDRYTLVLPENCRLTETDIAQINSGNVIVQNCSASGKGFLIDNLKVSDSVGRVLLKAQGGIVRNSTFSGLSYNVITCEVETRTWPEVGYLNDIQILNNRFESNNMRALYSEDWLRAGSMTDIQINAVGSGAVTEPDDCMHTNIVISGNVFFDRYARYAIRLNAVKNVRIVGNTFDAGHDGNTTQTSCAPILLLGGNGIEISDNTYPSDITARAENRGALNLTGNDVTE